MTGDDVSGRVLAVSGIRDILRSEEHVVADTLLSELKDVREVRFGGARGLDTMALVIAGQVQLERVVYVPFTVDDQPREAIEAIHRYATRVVQLRLPVPLKQAYLRRNDAMLEGADALLAYTDGRGTGGTSYTIGAANRRGVKYKIVRVKSS